LAALLGAPFDDSGSLDKPREAGTSASRAGDSTESAAGLGSDQRAETKAAGVATGDPKADILYLNVYEIDDNPFQPRRDFSEPEIASLAESLKEHDMLQPVLVRRIGERYQLISGERRLRAAIRAGWSTVPARVRQADDRLVAELAIVENLQRKDLNPIEKALSFKRYLDEHRCTQDDLAQRLKIDRSTIANLLRLLELPHSVLESLRKGELTAGHARALLPLGDEREQIGFAERITAEGLSVRDVERLVGEKIAELEGEILPFASPEDPPSKPAAAKSDQVGALEQRLRQTLGTKVEIRKAARGRGRMVVHFTSADEFERLYQLLCGGGSTSIDVA
jgi:ParB family chromosome partitioning protein